MAKHIEEFQKLNIRVNNIPEEHRINVFIGTLKDKIQHEVCLWESDSLEKAFRVGTVHPLLKCWDLNLQC